MARYIQEAFNHICTEAEQPGAYYVCLISSQQCYGGAEEGGWWYSVNNLEAFQEFPTEELAEAAATKVREFAEELSREARKLHGEHCLQTMEWLEARGLDADFLPEPDGEEKYEVRVLDHIPTFDNHRPHYE